MEISEIRITLGKSPREIIKDVVKTTHGTISDVLNEKTSGTRTSDLIVKVSTDLAEGMIELEAKIKEKYSVLL